MALAISQTQTVLWDQIRYVGDPREFAWVLPVRPGARIELSRDEWFASLENLSRTLVYPPGGSSRPVCSLGGCGASASDSSGSQSPEGVDVLAQAVVGPYEAVTLRATDPNALVDWLVGHGYAIPPAIEPVIAQYQKEQFDFIALRLRPGCNVRSMKPVRVVTPGADATLPLRMVAAGVGANVGITLFVLGEGRYHPTNFPDVTIDFGQLVWDRSAARSNYALLSQSALAEQGGRGFLTEYAGEMRTLESSYYAQCMVKRTGTGTGSAEPCDRDDAGAPSDASTPDAPAPVDSGANAGNACSAFDDFETAMRGLHPSDVWVTRLRASLPASALTQDLRLEAPFYRSSVSNVHYAVKAINCPPGSSNRSRYACSSAPGEQGKSDLGSLTIAAVAAISVASVLRRRRR
jgi:hypothetical protein